MYKIRIRNEVASGKSEAELFINSSIEHDNDYIENYISAKKLRDQLGNLEPEKIILHVNSEGGDLFEGLAIYNFLVELKNTGCYIEGIVEGICGSSASVVIMAADVIKMHKNSYMFIHEPVSSVIGTSEELEEFAGVTQELTEKIINIYVERTGTSPELIRELMRKESWLSADTCKLLNFCDEVIEAGSQVTGKSEAQVQIENRIRDSQGIRVSSVYRKPDQTQEAIKYMASVINKKRGFRDAR